MLAILIPPVAVLLCGKPIQFVRVKRDPPGEVSAAGKISIASTCGDGGNLTISGGLQLGSTDPLLVQLGFTASTESPHAY